MATKKKPAQKKSVKAIKKPAKVKAVKKPTTKKKTTKPTAAKKSVRKTTKPTPMAKMVVDRMPLPKGGKIFIKAVKRPVAKKGSKKTK